MEKSSKIVARKGSQLGDFSEDRTESMRLELENLTTMLSRKAHN